MALAHMQEMAHGSLRSLNWSRLSTKENILLALSRSSREVLDLVKYELLVLLEYTSYIEIDLFDC